MQIQQPDVERVIRSFLARAHKPAADLAPDTPLYAGGVGLDSLETAELSAVLEDSFGTDPYSAGRMPQTVGQILAFYDFAAADA
jgi:acyl carrier protein